MYTANKRQRSYKAFLRFTIFVLPLIAGLMLLSWYVFIRDNQTVSSNFSKEGAQVVVAKPAVKEFRNKYFKISLRTTWESNGRLNPFSDQVYYEFQDKAKDSTNRWLRVYVDTFPRDFPLNRLMPITVIDNQIVPGVASEDCTSFTGAPQSNTETKTIADTWMAKWQGITFVCAMTKPLNYLGTASVEEGLASTFINIDNSKHKYFFLYIDHNVRPDDTNLVDALKSFEPL